MRAARLLMAAGLAGVLAAAAVVSVSAVHNPGGPGSPSGLTQVDPAIVSQSCPPASGSLPCGELALESRVPTPFTLKVGTQPAHVFSNGAEVTVEHDQFPPHTTSGWHSHAGPVLVEVITGSLTLYEAADPGCKGTVYPAGTGFLEYGFGNVHDARNETDSPVDIYAEDILPPGSGDAGIYTPMPDFSNPDCPWPN